MSAVDILPAGKMARIGSKQNKLNNFAHAIMEQKQPSSKTGIKETKVFYLTINRAFGAAVPNPGNL